tara:strand:- start:822 stop:1049 length:228 start_codon:yes stop_codon:yes gene_type:complete
MYLIFPTEEAALERADEEGKDNNFSYWTCGMGTRWLTKPVATADGQWALDVTEYDLDDLEQATAVESVVFPEPEE